MHEIEKLMIYGHPLEEAADIIGVSRAMIMRWKRMDPEVRQAVERGRSKMKHRLRKLQLNAAERLNPLLLIHLGKVHLDQANLDSKVTLAGDANNPLQIESSAAISAALAAYQEHLFALRRERLQAPEQRAIEANVSEPNACYRRKRFLRAVTASRRSGGRHGFTSGYEVAAVRGAGSLAFTTLRRV